MKQGFITEDSIETFSLHDASIIDIWVTGSSMFWKIEGGIVCGISCKENRTNCANDGEDRYAEPYLVIEFQDFEILSFLRGGCKKYRNNELIDEYPSQFLFRDQYQKTLEDIVNDKSNVIYVNKEISTNPTIISIDFFGGTDPQYYILQLSITKIITSWKTFGHEAWYLKWYKEANKQ